MRVTNLKLFFIKSKITIILFTKTGNLIKCITKIKFAASNFNYKCNYSNRIQYLTGDLRNKLPNLIIKYPSLIKASANITHTRKKNKTWKYLLTFNNSPLWSNSHLEPTFRVRQSVITCATQKEFPERLSINFIPLRTRNHNSFNMLLPPYRFSLNVISL